MVQTIRRVGKTILLHLGQSTSSGVSSSTGTDNWPCNQLRQLCGIIHKTIACQIADLQLMTMRFTTVSWPIRIAQPACTKMQVGGVSPILAAMVRIRSSAADRSMEIAS